MERSCAYAQPAILALPLVERAPWNAPLMREDLYIFVAAALLRVLTNCYGAPLHVFWTLPGHKR